MTNPVKSAIDGVKLVIAIVFVVILLGALGSCNYYMNKANGLAKDIALMKKEGELQEQKYISQAQQAEINYKEQEKIANEKYVEDLKVIYDNALANRGIIERVREIHNKTVEHLSDMERSALEEKYRAKSEQLVEGATLLAEVDGIARGYNAELDECLAKYPKPPKKTGKDKE